MVDFVSYVGVYKKIITSIMENSRSCIALYLHINVLHYCVYGNWHFYQLLHYMFLCSLLPDLFYFFIRVTCITFWELLYIFFVLCPYFHPGLSFKKKASSLTVPLLDYSFILFYSSPFLS